MVQYVTSSINLVSGNLYKCWFCTNFIKSEPIGCPIGVSHSSGTKTYSTSGVFCSFNCIKAYINEKTRADVLYNNSHVLLAHMICDMRGTISPVSVDPAPDKCLMAVYGGYMTEDQYKQCFDRIVYSEKGKIKMFPTTSIFQEEEKLSRNAYINPCKQTNVSELKNVV